MEIIYVESKASRMRETTMLKAVVEPRFMRQIMPVTREVM